MDRYLIKNKLFGTFCKYNWKLKIIRTEIYKTLKFYLCVFISNDQINILSYSLRTFVFFFFFYKNSSV